MSDVLLNLDDRRWVDLVEQGRALIPFYAPEWTDHNEHDPGITLVELFAWLAEMDIYELNRIPDSRLLDFLALLDVRPGTGRPALVPVHLGIEKRRFVRVSAGVEFQGPDAFGTLTRFRSLQSVVVIDTALVAVQLKDSQGFHDLSPAWRRGEVIAPWGSDPRSGAELYLGFDQALPRRVPLSLLALSAEQLVSDPSLRLTQARQHHSARLSWEHFSAAHAWKPLVVDDQTAAFTDGGLLRLTAREASAAEAIGHVDAPLHYVRARITEGQYDDAPRLRYLDANSVLTAQVTAAAPLSWSIDEYAVVEGPPPRAGARLRFLPRIGAAGKIEHLTFDDPNSPCFRLLGYTPNTGSAAGRLSIEAVRVGFGDGRPSLRLLLPEERPLPETLRVFTLEHEHWRSWELRRDFDASRRTDAHFTLVADPAALVFGDGERGRAVPAGAPVIVSYDASRLSAGNLPAGRITELADSARNRALLGRQRAEVALCLARINNPLPAEGGAEPETVPHALGRAIEATDQSERAVTLSDYETQALACPGVRLARVAARANVHPAFPGLLAPGVMTLIVMPHLPRERPVPSPELLRAVARHLQPRRVLGTRVEVIGPRFRVVSAQVRLAAVAGVLPGRLLAQVAESLKRFLSPLAGGPEATGWPFGRSVYRSEVLQVIQETSGVDHVSSLALSLDGAEPVCGNLCLGFDELVVSGQHQVEFT
jgi:hypothetical protein